MPASGLGMAREVGMSSREALHSSASNEWYTPTYVVEAARQAMGGIELDPASCELANRTVKARHYFTPADDGLSQRWQGKVWLNPPYGRPGAKIWVSKLLRELEAGRVTQACLLVNATPATRWFQPLWQFPILFTRKRIAFYNEAGQSKSPSHSNAIVLAGVDLDRADVALADLGVIVTARGVPA